jgi:hypothetical protein
MVNYMPTETIDRPALDALIALGVTDRTYEAMRDECVKHFATLSSVQQATTSVEHLLMSAQRMVRLSATRAQMQARRELSAAADRLLDTEDGQEIRRLVLKCFDAEDLLWAEDDRGRDLDAAAGRDPSWPNSESRD